MVCIQVLSQEKSILVFGQKKAFFGPTCTTFFSSFTDKFEGYVIGLKAQCAVMGYGRWSPPSIGLRECNRLRCPLARMSGLQCFNMGHNGHGINLYGVSMTLMEN